MVGGIAVLSLGHSHPQLIKALNKQAKKVWHISNAFQAPEGEKLAKKIADEIGSLLKIDKSLHKPQFSAVLGMLIETQNYSEIDQFINEKKQNIGKLVSSLD